MKWSEAVLDALGEIDEELIPLTGGDDMAGEEDLREKRRRRSMRRGIRTAATLAALALFAGLLPPLRSGVKQAGTMIMEDTDPSGKAGDIPFFLGRTAPEDRVSLERVVPLFDADPSEDGGPLIFTGEDPAGIALPASPVFTDREGRTWRMVSPADHSEDPLIRSLRMDAEFAGTVRSYGCVQWEADWNAGMAVFRGIVPLLSPQETLKRLLAGGCVTSVPEEEIPVITEERIGRRIPVYLASPSEDRITLYDAFFVRLDEEPADAAGAETRWGLFFVSAAADTEEDRS